MDIRFNKHDVYYGLFIYAAGDTIAALILGQFMWTRLAGMMCLGATVYALEIPTWFRWIDRHTKSKSHGLNRILIRTGLALLYFNPLWIARHLLFIAVFSAEWHALEPALLQTALFAWLVNIPLSITGNAIIQGVLPLRWRFIGSATFSALMAVYYAFSGVWFHAGS